MYVVHRVVFFICKDPNSKKKIFFNETILEWELYIFAEKSRINW